MTATQAFILGVLIAYSPSLVFIAITLLRTPAEELNYD